MHIHPDRTPRDPASKGWALPLLLAAVAVLGAAPAMVGHPTWPEGARQAAPQPLDRALVARGDSIFHGRQAGAICATCHGQDARGLPGLGPNLTDKEWLHGDGSLAFLRTLIPRGVPKPRKSQAIMPPYGGVPLDSAQVHAVASYVFSLGHR